MKTKLLTALLAFTAVCTTKADFLFWEADANPYGIEYNYASIYTMKGEEKLFLDNAGYNSTDAIGDVIEKGSFAAAVINGDYSKMTFYVDLYNSEMGLVGTTKDGILGSSLTTYIASDTVNENMTSHQRLSLKGREFVPEPTSGILMLLGMGLLGLKRKRA